MREKDEEEKMAIAVWKEKVRRVGNGGRWMEKRKGKERRRKDVGGRGERRKKEEERSRGGIRSMKKEEE